MARLLRRHLRRPTLASFHSLHRRPLGHDTHQAAGLRLLPQLRRPRREKVGNTGLTVLVGQVAAVYTVLGSDAALHMAEEIRGAGVVILRTMWRSFVANMPLALAMLLSYLFNIGSVDACARGLLRLPQQHPSASSPPPRATTAHSDHQP
ncbi:hypothetical protein LTS18_009074, partial [Coniosporium uncinatum]